MKTASNQLLVIFGASGDLTGRKLLPSLYELHVRGLLPERFCILGAARTEYTDDEYRAFEKVHIRESLKNKEVDDVELDSFLRRVFYLAFDSTNSAGYHKLKDRIHQLRQEQQLPDKIIYYLATPAGDVRVDPDLPERKRDECCRKRGRLAPRDRGEAFRNEPRIGRTSEQASHPYLR